MHPKPDVPLTATTGQRLRVRHEESDNFASFGTWPFCISLWKREMGQRDGLLFMNTRIHADPPDQWQAKVGNRRRIGHLRRAVDQLGGRVDVVIVSGEPGVSYGTAQPWVAEGGRAGTWWQVTEFDEATGDFEVVLRRG